MFSISVFKKTGTCKCFPLAQTLEPWCLQHQCHWFDS